MGCGAQRAEVERLLCSRGRSAFGVVLEQQGSRATGRRSTSLAHRSSVVCSSQAAINATEDLLAAPWGSTTQVSHL